MEPKKKIKRLRKRRNGSGAVSLLFALGFLRFMFKAILSLNPFTFLLALLLLIALWLNEAYAFSPDHNLYNKYEPIIIEYTGSMRADSIYNP